LDVAKRLGVADKCLYLWMRLAKEQQGLGNGETANLRCADFLDHPTPSR
jgi:transposase-like protein